MNPNASNVNTGNANLTTDTYYYNSTTSGSGVPLWNITGGTGVPLDLANLSQNVGNNPFTATETEGLYINGSNLFAALGSTIISAGTTSVDTLQIVTKGGGGVLRLNSGIVAQGTGQSTIATKDFYVPGDFNGDGVVGPPDYSLLLFAFNQHYTTQAAWDGALPVNASGIVGPGDYSNLLFNFNAGLSFGAGAGGEAVGGSDVPEPTSAVMMALASGVMALVGRRRRRS